MPKLVLASQSPRRNELLSTAGFEFTVRARPVEEVRRGEETPGEYVLRLAREKAEAAWEGADEIVLGSDTVVVLGNRMLEKPADAAEAQEMLRALSGREHTVITGVCLRHAAGAIVDSESTRVRFVELDDREIEKYVRSG